MSGTVRISRDMWDDDAFKDESFSEREAWVWLIAEASWKARTRRIGNAVVSLERGQLACSVRFMADRWKWSKSKVHRFLDRLKNRDMIGTASGTGVLVVTVCNYDEYQSAPKSSGTASERDAGQQRDSSGTNENKGEIRGKGREEDPDGSLSESSSDAPPDPAPLDPTPPDPVPADDVAAAVSAYNAAAEHVGWPKVQKVTPARRKSLKARLAEAGGPTGWEHALSRARASDFLSGRNGRWSSFGFDWLIKQQNFTKLMEGNYDNRDRPDPAGRDRGFPERSATGGHGRGGSFASSVARRQALRQNRD